MKLPLHLIHCLNNVGWAVALIAMLKLEPGELRAMIVALGGAVGIGSYFLDNIAIAKMEGELAELRDHGE